MKYLILILFLIVTSCSGRPCQLEANRKEQQRIFKECMKLLPKGPERTHYNDWDEVVKACNGVAYSQSLEQVCPEDK